MPAPRKKVLTLLSATLMCTTLVGQPSFAAPQTAEMQQELNNSTNVTQTAVLPETDRLIIKFKDGVTEEQKATVLSSLKKEEASVETTDVVKDSVADDTSLNVIDVGSMLNEAEQSQAVEALEKSDLVEVAEPDKIVQASAGINKNAEPYSYLQWQLDNLDVASAWNTATGNGQRIAIVDTGYNWHPDLAPNTIPGYDFISDPWLSADGDGRDSNPADVAPGTGFHGNFTAGMATADNNGFGVIGTAPDAKAMHIRVLGRNTNGYQSDIADGVVYAAGGSVAGVGKTSTPATVINMSMSWTSPSCPAVIKSAIDFAYSKNVPVVVAAGNAAMNANNATPANCLGAIVVGATASNNSLASFTNYGPMLDVVAPGVNVYSTTANSYGWNSGTSFSAPATSGVLALMKEANPDLTIEQIRKILGDTGVNVSGYKKVTASRAVASAKSLAKPTFKLIGGIGAHYYNTGGAAKYGQPTTNEFPIRDGGRAQQFSNGYTIYWHPNLGTASVYFKGAIGGQYRAEGFENGLGFPVEDEKPVSGGGYRQRFAQPDGRVTAVYWTPQYGTKKVWEPGGIGGKYRAAGESNGYGLPITNEVPENGGVYQDFIQGGYTTRVYWSPSTGTRAVNRNGDIHWVWKNNGGENRFGFPVTDELSRPGGAVVYFKKGTSETGAYWSPSTGTKFLNSRGAIYYHWLQNGYIEKFGYPTTDESVDSLGRVYVKFSGGKTIFWTPNRGVWVG